MLDSAFLELNYLGVQLQIKVLPPYYMSQAVDAIRAHLQSVMETGKMAERQMKELRKKSFL